MCPATNNMKQSRKHPRLNKSIYSYPTNPCSITICTKNRKIIFGHQAHEFTKNCISILEKISSEQGMFVHIALFMPDHVHLCVEISKQCNIIDFVKKFKSCVAVYAIKNDHKNSIWQTSFFDHFIRSSESVKTVVLYILNNPCRKNLISKWWLYPYRYSNVYTEKDLLNI